MILSRFPLRAFPLEIPRRGWQGDPFDEAIQPDQSQASGHRAAVSGSGDFYETFGADAVAAANVLNIVLTKRGNGSASEVELAGFPHHSLDTYLPKLVKSGLKVAVCDQLEDPKQAKGLGQTRRDGTRHPGIGHARPRAGKQVQPLRGRDSLDVQIRRVGPVGFEHRRIPSRRRRRALDRPHPSKP